MVPVGALPVGAVKMPALCARCSEGDMGLNICRTGGLPGVWKGRETRPSSCVDSTLGGRVMEGRLWDAWVSMGDGDSICEALLRLFRCCSTSCSCGFRMERRPLQGCLSVGSIGGVLDTWRRGGRETG
jgi:hypothetical protein